MDGGRGVSEYEYPLTFPITATSEKSIEIIVCDHRRVGCFLYVFTVQTTWVGEYLVTVITCALCGTVRLSSGEHKFAFNYWGSLKGLLHDQTKFHKLLLKPEFVKPNHLVQCKMLLDFIYAHFYDPYFLLDGCLPPSVYVSLYSASACAISR